MKSQPGEKNIVKPDQKKLQTQASQKSILCKLTGKNTEDIAKKTILCYNLTFRNNVWITEKTAPHTAQCDAVL